MGSTERDNYLMLKSGVNAGAWRLRASNGLTANSDDKPHWTTSGARRARPDELAK